MYKKYILGLTIKMYLFAVKHLELVIQSNIVKLNSVKTNYCRQLQTKNCRLRKNMGGKHKGRGCMTIHNHTISCTIISYKVAKLFF